MGVVRNEVGNRVWGSREGLGFDLEGFEVGRGGWVRWLDVYWEYFICWVKIYWGVLVVGRREVEGMGRREILEFIGYGDGMGMGYD